MNKSAALATLLLCLSISAFAQLGKYMPFVLVIQAPDSIAVDPALMYCIDSMQIRLARNYNTGIEKRDSILTAFHAKDSLFIRRYIEYEEEMRSSLTRMKELGSKVRSYKYTYLMSEYAEYEYQSLFNEFPPYSYIVSVVGAVTQDESAKAEIAKTTDYVVSFKNVRTVPVNGSWELKLTTVLYSPKKKKVLLETETGGYLTKDDVYSNRNILNSLFVSAAKSSASAVSKVISKRQEVEGWFPADRGSYPILNRVLDLITYTNNISEHMLYRKLLTRLDSLFALKMTYDFKDKFFTAGYNNKDYIIAERDDFLKMCKSIKPAITATLASNNLETDYDFYISDMMMFTFNEMSCISRLVVGMFSSPCLKIKVKNGVYSFEDYAEDLDHTAFGGGWTINEINSIPVKYLTRGTLMHELYKNRNGMVSIRLEGEVVQRNIQLKGCEESFSNGMVYLLDKQGNCYINFGTYIGWKVSNPLHTLLSADCGQIKNIIIDLSKNEGGTLSESLDLTNLFLKRGLTMAKLTGKDSTSYISLNYNLCNNVPITVLVSHKTYGGAEVMASLLKEYRKATIIGEETSGMVSILQRFKLLNNYIAHIAVGNFIVAGKYDLTTEPVKPDFSYSSSEFDKLNLDNFR